MAPSGMSDNSLILVTVCMLVSGGAMMVGFLQGDRGTSEAIAISLFFVTALARVGQLLYRQW
jgi:hypothetical protein